MGGTLFRAAGRVAAIFVLLVWIPAAGAQDEGIDDLRDDVEELTRTFHALEDQLHELEEAIAETQRQRAEAQNQIALHRQSVIQTAVIGFTRSYETPVVLRAEDLAEGVRAESLSDAAVGKDDDALNRYTAAVAELDVLDVELADELAEQQRAVDEMAALRNVMQDELSRLEEIEAARLEEIRQRVERAVAQGHTFVELDACPVAGAHSFIDSWGFARSGGRRHKGVDIMAVQGVPLVAPVSGTVVHRGNRVGGLSYHLDGDDGNYYYGTHLSAYGASGWVEAGTVIGYIGDTGNASGIPHLHFEIHPKHGKATNPYPSVAYVCNGAS